MFDLYDSDVSDASWVVFAAESTCSLRGNSSNGIYRFTCCSEAFYYFPTGLIQISIVPYIVVKYNTHPPPLWCNRPRAHTITISTVARPLHTTALADVSFRRFEATASWAIKHTLVRLYTYIVHTNCRRQDGDNNTFRTEIVFKIYEYTYSSIRRIFENNNI